MEHGHICHAFSTFACGGPQVRTAAIINAIGSRARHTIVAMDNRFDARSFIAQSARVEYCEPPPGKGNLTYALALRTFLKELGPDVLVTYNWGAMDAVVGAQLGRVCPVVHTEDGFGPDEVRTMKRRRLWARRVALRRIFGTVVPSRTLQRIVVEKYAIPATKVFLIENGVDASQFAQSRDAALRRSLGIPDHAVLVGSVGGLRAEKNFSLLIEAVAAVRHHDVWLMLVGDGPCRELLMERARARDVAHKVVFAGHRTDTARLYPLFDVFALSSKTEQLPMALLEAMAAGRACMCTAVGDCPEVLASHSAPEIVPTDSLAAYADALSTLCGSPELRQRLGAKNRHRAIGCFASDRMIREYERVYADARQGARSLTGSIL